MNLALRLYPAPSCEEAELISLFLEGVRFTPVVSYGVGLEEV